MSTILRTVGIDISKDWLDAFAAPDGRTSRFPNDEAGFRRLIVWIGSGVDRIAYEPTGPFHRDFEDSLLKDGLALYAINPFQVRSFARSLGRRAKTDAVDARMLATMAAPSRICVRLRFLGFPWASWPPIRHCAARTALPRRKLLA